jgi:hypothetical protein
VAQVDFLKLLYDKLLELHLKHADKPEERHYPRPSFKVWLHGRIAGAAAPRLRTAPFQRACSKEQ